MAATVELTMLVDSRPAENHRVSRSVKSLSGKCAGTLPGPILPLLNGPVSPSPESRTSMQRSGCQPRPVWRSDFSSASSRYEAAPYPTENSGPRNSNRRNASCFRLWPQLIHRAKKDSVAHLCHCSAEILRQEASQTTVLSFEHQLHEHCRRRSVAGFKLHAEALAPWRAGAVQNPPSIPTRAVRGLRGNSHLAQCVSVGTRPQVSEL